VKTIEIIVDPGGKTTVQTRGFIGPECKEASKAMEQALGQREGQTLTAEYYQDTPLRQQAVEKT
jgi:hypothetical protein